MQLRTMISIYDRVKISMGPLPSHATGMKSAGRGFRQMLT